MTGLTEPKIVLWENVIYIAIGISSLNIYCHLETILWLTVFGAILFISLALVHVPFSIRTWYLIVFLHLTFYQESVKSRHPQLHYESKLYMLLQGGSKYQYEDMVLLFHILSLVLI